MKKIFANFILIFTIFFNTSVFADKIDSIKIIGNKRVSNETILLFSKISKNSEITNENELNNIFKNLYETNFFSDIKISFENSILTIVVEENPIIQKVEFKGIKSNKLQESVYEYLILKNKSSFVKRIANKDINSLKNALKTSGYYFADVELEIKENTNDTINLIYNINLGEKALITKINFFGNKIYKDRKLRNLITSEESKFWKFISNKKYLDVKRINLDNRLLKSYFLNKGYYNVDVTSSFASYIEESNFELTFTINAGEKFFLNEINLIIPDDFDPKPFDKIVSHINDLKGKNYSLLEIEKIIKLIERISLINDYEFMDANINEKIVDNNKLNINITVEENKDKYFVNQINIFGNSFTEETVVRNYLILGEGDALNNLIYSKSINEIKSLGIFKSVKSEIVDSGIENKKDINIDIEEKATGEISAGAGVGTSGGTIGFGIKENNFIGKGIKLSSDIVLTEETIKGGIDYSNPKFRNTDKSLNFGLGTTVTDKLANYGYKSSYTSFFLGTGFEQYDDLFYSPQLTVSYDKVETSNTASSALKKQKGDYFTTGISYGIDYDKRNQKFQTSSGTRQRFRQAIPIYSEELAFSTSYEFNSYFEVMENIVSSLSLSGGFITALETNEDVRITQRLSIPSRKLRGFETGRIGPVDGKDHVGGNYSATLNFNTDLPVLESMQNTDVKWFFDAANLWGVDYRNYDDDSSKIRSSTGVAVDWYTPIGPLNFSFSQILTSKDTDIKETFRFSIGTTF